MLLYRPEYYNITEDGEGNSTIGVAEIIIAKNRSGPVDSVKLRFIGRYASFRDLDESFFESYEEKLFKEIRQNEFNPNLRGSKMNDIEEDKPF